MSKRRKIVISNESEVLSENDSQETHLVEYIECPDIYIINDQELVTTNQFVLNENNSQFLQNTEQKSEIQIEEVDIQNEENNQSNSALQESMEYTMISGSRDKTCYLYCDGQLYLKNRVNYYRCRLHPYCMASGRRNGKMFQLIHPHSDHGDQEDMRKSLMLLNSLKIKSRDDPENFHDIFDKECSKPEFSDVVDDVNNKLLSTKILKRNRHAFNVISELLKNDSKQPEDNSDGQILNDFNQTPYVLIEGLAIRTRVLYSAGHIYLHTGVNSYRCYLYPKCLGSGHTIGRLFQLMDVHSNHGLKHDEKDRLLLIVAIKRKVQLNPGSLEQIYQEECSRPEYEHIRNKVSLEMIQKLLADQGTIKSDIDNQTEVNVEDKDADIKVPKTYTIINGGSNGHILYCDEQLYNYNRVGYYRCRLYQQGCPATGRCGDETFSLLRGHVGHGSQVDEKNRLILVETLKKRASTEQLPLQTIYDEEMEKPEFNSVSHLVPYRVMYKTMRKSRHTALLRREEQTEQYPETQITEVKVYDVNELQQHEYDTETVLENAITYCEVNEDGEIEEIEDMKQNIETNYEPPSFESNSKNRTNIYPAMEYSLMEGERLGSCILYCNEQLYTLNRSNYYRCRLYAAGCQATGMRDGTRFRLCRDHSFHGSQEPERRRITLINTIKKRTMTNPDPDYFETVFNQECEKSEYADIVEKVSFTVVLNNMRKIWKRYQQQDPTLARNIMKNENLNDLKHKLKPKPNKANDADDQEVSRMAVEIGDDIPCDQDMSPQEYSLMEGERLGSCLLYCKQQLYTNNQRNYYRCRMYAAGCRATGIMRADRFHLIRAHNGHGTQEREVKRLLLVTAIKRRAQIDPTRLQTIFDEECARPEFRDVADMVCFKKIYSTLDRCRRRAAVDLLEVIEPKIPPGISGDTEAMSDQQSNIKIYHKTEPQEIMEMEWQEDPDSQDEQCREEYNEPDNKVNVTELNTKDSLQSNTSVEQMQQKLISELGLSDANAEETYDDANVTISQQNNHSNECDKTNYMFLSGDRFGSKLLYSDGHIYCLNRNNYYRCRIYPHCIATGRVYGNKFKLHRGHSAHALQNDERDRLLLMNSIKTRVRLESERSIKEIFEEESSKSEFRDVAQMINYKTALSTLIKCRNRASMAIDEVEDKKYENNHFVEIEKYDSDIEIQETALPVILDEPGIVWSRGESPISDIENTEIPKPNLNVPVTYILIQGDRTGSRILYSNGHLYTRNRGNYYRCRNHPICPGSGARRGSFFYMTRQHSEHPLQDDERIRLEFMYTLKTRCLSETTSFKQIFDEEITKPEYSSISDLVSFKMIQSTMVKIRERIKYGGFETGTIMSSSSNFLKQFDNLEYIESDDSQDNDYEHLKTLKKIDENDIEDSSAYYYIFDADDFDSDVEFVQECNIDDSVEYSIFFSNEQKQAEEKNSIKPLKVYVIDIEKQKNLTSCYENAKVHLPEIDEKMLTENFLNQRENNFNKPIHFKMVEDAMYNTFLVYTDKQLYRILNEKQGICVCRVRCCPAEGVIKGNVFILKTPHNSHALQDKARLQMKLISRIKSRSLAKRSARVSKIFREECLRPEFRSVMCTVTLDGISDLIKRHKRKLYPRQPQILEELITNNKGSDLPPPTEFSIVTCSTPGIRLLHSEQSLYYHISKGFYKCAIEGCPSQGRRDRTFFQILQPHSIHEVIDINNKEQILNLINLLETKFIKDKNVLDETISDSEDKILNKQPEVLSVKEPHVKYKEKVDVPDDDENENKTQDYELDSDNTQNRDILQRAWDLLQIPAI